MQRSQYTTPTGGAREAEHVAQKKRRAREGHGVLGYREAMNGAREAYAWNELPQPQVLVALGFSKVKPRFSRPS